MLNQLVVVVAAATAVAVVATAVVEVGTVVVAQVPKLTLNLYV